MRGVLRPVTLADAASPSRSTSRSPKRSTVDNFGLPNGDTGLLWPLLDPGGYSAGVELYRTGRGRVEEGMAEGAERGRCEDDLREGILSGTGPFRRDEKELGDMVSAESKAGLDRIFSEMACEERSHRKYAERRFVIKRYSAVRMARGR